MDGEFEACLMCGLLESGPLVGIDLRHGDSIEAMSRSIAEGFPDSGMPGFSGTLDADAIQRLAIFIGEQRASLA